MKNDNFITYALLGLGALGVFLYFKNRKNKVKTVTEGELVASIVKEEEDKYSTPFVQDYKIVLPADLISKRLKEKAAQLKAGRFAIQEEKVNKPLYI